MSNAQSAAEQMAENGLRFMDEQTSRVCIATTEDGCDTITASRSLPATAVVKFTTDVLRFLLRNGHVAAPLQQAAAKLHEADIQAFLQQSGLDPSLAHLLDTGELRTSCDPGNAQGRQIIEASIRDIVSAFRAEGCTEAEIANLLRRFSVQATVKPEMKARFPKMQLVVQHQAVVETQTQPVQAQLAALQQFHTRLELFNVITEYAEAPGGS